MFGAVWWVWLSTTMYVNRFRRTDFGHRLLVLLQMVLVALMAMEARAGVVDDEAALLITYAALVGTIAVMYMRSSKAAGHHGAFARRMAGVHLVAVACFLAASPCPEGIRIAGAFVGMAVMIVPAILRSTRLADFPPIDEEHLLERMGAFTIIVCGEAFVKVAIAVSNNSIDGVDVVALVFQFVLTFALWASYFEDIPHAGINLRRIGPWLACHLLTQLGIAGTAIGVSKLVSLGFLEELPAEHILEIMAALALVYVGLAGIGVCTRRRPRRPLLLLRLGTALAVVVVAFAAWQIPWIDLVEGVALLTAVALVHTFAVAALRSRTVIVAME